ncbi:hypothetical protein ITX31_02205 [Arthrobacter gandavensis]|uniref:hypothetical protein n=1 Tax=Arthrobacter gandavensis TaxID=169960 RepID=UPI00188E023E|nr:hypothetical protein [Arthrobacter gandavensis]MBF4992922.1 hypothetical protein [Arthrobacter gandavensis]
MPPQLAGVQQRPFYVKARSVITAVSLVWLVLAVAGYGSFSGGTTSLALSLAMMYGTGVAIVVVASAAYRLLKRSAVRRAEHAPEDAAAAAFIDATRFAAEEIRAALTPARPGARPAVSAWSADSRQVAAAAPVFREPGAEAASSRELLGRKEGAAAAPAAALSEAAAGTPAAAPAAGKGAAGKNPSAGKSVVNKKASAKKKKSSKPRPAEAGKLASGPAAGKPVPSAVRPGSRAGGEAQGPPPAVQDMKRAA